MASVAWSWFDVLVPRQHPTKPHPDVQCRACGKTIKSAMLSGSVLPHAAFKCERATPETIATARRLLHERSTGREKPPAQKKRKRASPIKHEGADEAFAFHFSEQAMDTENGAGFMVAEAFYALGVPLETLDNPIFHGILAALNPNVALPPRAALEAVLGPDEPQEASN